MNNNEEFQQIALAILKHAQEEKNLEFRFLQSWPEYLFYLDRHRSLKYIIKVLYTSATRLFKSYCRAIAIGKADFTELIAYQQIVSVVNFYKQDLFTITEMVDEYQHYLLYGNFFWSILGRPRPSLDLVDYRGRK